MKTLFKIISITLSVVVVILVSIIAYVVTALPSVGAAETITIEPTPARIERGEYLANHVAVCIDCHSTRDWSSFARPMVPGTAGAGGEAFDQDMGFPGVFYAPNIYTC